MMLTSSFNVQAFFDFIADIKAWMAPISSLSVRIKMKTQHTEQGSLEAFIKAFIKISHESSNKVEFFLAPMNFFFLLMVLEKVIHIYYIPNEPLELCMLVLINQSCSSFFLWQQDTVNIFVFSLFHF